MALRSMAASQLSSCAETRSGEKEQQPDKTATRPSAPCLLLWAPRIQVAVRRLSPGMMGSQFSGSAAPRARSTRARCWARRHRAAGGRAARGRPRCLLCETCGLKRLTSRCERKVEKAPARRPAPAAPAGARPGGTTRASGCVRELRLRTTSLKPLRLERQRRFRPSQQSSVARVRGARSLDRGATAPARG